MIIKQHALVSLGEQEHEKGRFLIKRLWQRLQQKSTNNTSAVRTPGANNIHVIYGTHKAVLPVNC